MSENRDEKSLEGDRRNVPCVGVPSGLSIEVEVCGASLMFAPFADVLADPELLQKSLWAFVSELMKLAAESLDERDRALFQESTWRHISELRDKAAESGHEEDRAFLGSLAEVLKGWPLLPPPPQEA